MRFCFAAALGLVIALAALTPPASIAAVNEVTTYAAVPGTLFGLAFDTGGNLFVSSSGSVYKVAPGGSPVALFVTGMWNVKGLAFDATGNLYVADWGDNLSNPARVWKVTPAGVKSTFATLSSPAGLAFDGSGNLLVSQWGVHNVAKVTPAGAVSTYAASISGVNEEVGQIEYDPATGDLYAACESTIKKIAPGGSPVPTAVSGLTSCQYGMARGTDGSFYMARYSHSDLYYVSPGGSVSAYAGAHLATGCGDGPLLDARFSLPAFEVIRDNILYIADAGCHLVRTIDLDGATPTVGASWGRLKSIYR
jgi:hypothetical protein